MVDLRELLQSSNIMNSKPPELLPNGKYPGVITKHEFGSTKSDNPTPYVRYHVKLTGWPEGEEAVDGVDITKRNTQVDFWLTPDSFYILARFLKALGIEDEGEGDEVLLGKPVGSLVLATIAQEPAKKGSEELANRGKRLEAL
jgi:hypothetical protein